MGPANATAVVAVCVSVVSVVCALAGCPDPCILTGNACNVSADCNANKVCDLNPNVEGGRCPIVGGLCIAGECGSDADCALGCCEPFEHVCTQQRFLCASASRCADDSACDASDTCSDGECVQRCAQDVDCPGTARCSSGHCTAELGVACLDAEGCHGGSCAAVDVNGNHVDNYCTDSCIDLQEPGQKIDCGPALVCASGEECRVP